MGEIIIAVAAVGITGLFFGIVLVLGAKFFSVEENETEQKITEVLPGANCGGCGFSGCAGYAKAVASGEAEGNLCAPGGSNAAKRIAEILGKEAKSRESLVACVMCNGTKDVAGRKFEYGGIRSCKAANMFYSGDKNCAYGCLGYGDCEKICDFSAIRIIDGVARINRNDCRGCNRCAEVCPKGIIRLVPKDAKVAVLCQSKDSGAQTLKKCKNGCIGCRKCEKECPTGAISVRFGYAETDFQKCNRCGHCAKVCPTGAICGSEE